MRRYDIVVRYTEEFRDSPAGLLVKSPTGTWVLLRELATVEEMIGPRQITRENNQRFVAITLNVMDRDIGRFVAEAREAIEAKVELSPGDFTVWGGQYKLQQEANRRFAVVIPITLILVLFLKYSNFKSLKSSLPILLNIPLALVGGVFGLYVTGEYLSVPASVGFIALFGIAVQNGLVLVTYINQLRSDGTTVTDAVRVLVACQTGIGGILDDKDGFLSNLLRVK